MAIAGSREHKESVASDKCQKDRVLDIICYGRERAITGKQIADIMGSPNDRNIRIIIGKHIEEGIPIASATKPPVGFYIADTEGDALEYANNLHARLVSNSIRLKNFKLAAKHLLHPRQLAMLDTEEYLA